jgi:hypothetical protein
MTLKNAALLALIGMALLTLLLLADLIIDVSALAQGVIPVVRVVRSLIYAFAGLSAVVFLYVFHKAQA